MYDRSDYDYISRRYLFPEFMRFIKSDDDPGGIIGSQLEERGKVYTKLIDDYAGITKIRNISKEIHKWVFFWLIVLVGAIVVREGCKIIQRVLTIEDTRELIVPHKNRVHITLSRTEQTNALNYAKVIDLVVRFTPDAIIGGEISTGNAGALWELMGSGHDNCLATIHAESSEAAYQAFTDRIMHSYPQTDRNKTIEEMRKKLRVVQINRDGNLRAVTEIT